MHFTFLQISTLNFIWQTLEQAAKWISQDEVSQIPTEGRCPPSKVLVQPAQTGVRILIVKNNVWLVHLRHSTSQMAVSGLSAQVLAD